jgi:L-tyrosine isonitrile synthase
MSVSLTVAARKLTPKQPAEPVPEHVLRSFNSWAFKREQPTEPALLQQTVAAAMERRLPIPFVLYWGRGQRSHPGRPEAKCLDFLAGMISRIEKQYPQGAVVTLILTDTHAALNGYDKASTDGYFSAIAQAAADRGFSCCRLSSIVDAHPLKSALGTDHPDPEVMARLRTCAAKWYRGDGGPATGAEQYYAMNMVEKRAIDAGFPDAIFITFNGSEYRPLFPDRLPVFFMHSMRKGTSVKPWFETDDQPESVAVSDNALSLS